MTSNPSRILGFALFSAVTAFAGNTFPSSGNAGIGTTSPATSLHIVGPFTGGLMQQAIQASGSDDRAGLSFWSVSTQRLGFLYVGADGDYITGTDVSGHLRFFSNGTERLTIDTSGNVGIGIYAPYGGTDFKSLDIRGVSGGTVSLGSTSARMGVFYSHAGATTLGSVNAAPLVFTTSDTERVRVDASGNVGIGTASPTQKLAVNGTVRAKEVIVDTGWSDYVFDSNYRLAPLSEVEAHIKANGHLPDIPSAQEVADHGVSVGEMQSKLLAKIEELTLHQIAQEKRLNAQAARIALLEQENSALRPH